MQDWKDHLVDDMVIHKCHKSHALITVSVIHRILLSLSTDIQLCLTSIISALQQHTCTTWRACKHEESVGRWMQVFLNLKNMHKDLQTQQEKAMVHTRVNRKYEVTV